MATLDWPTGPAWLPTRFAFSASTPRSAWASFFTGQQQSISHAGDRLRIDMTLPACDYASAAYREAFLLRLASAGDWVRLGHFQRPIIAGDLRGAPVVRDSQPAGSRTLLIRGGTTSTNLLTATQTFNVTADWTFVNGLTVSPNTHARPNSGIFSADTITDANESGSAYISQSITIPDDLSEYTASVHVRKTSGGTSATFALEFIMSGGSVPVNGFVRINTDTGAVLSASGTSTATSDGLYWRISRTRQNNATGNNVLEYRLFPARAVHNNGVGETGSVTGSAVVWGAQVEVGGAMTGYRGSPSLVPGDVFSVGSQLLVCGYDGDVQTNASFVTANLAIPLRRPVTAGDPVTWFKPTGNFQLVGESVAAVEYLPGRYQTAMNLQFVEVY
jgi:hypothetical protein